MAILFADGIDWVSLLQTFGLAVCILFFLGFSAVRIAHWVAPRLDKTFERFLKGLDKVETFEDRITRVEERIDLLWEFQLKRASVEAEIHGVGKMNSPLVVTEEAKSWLSGMKSELQTLYRNLVIEFVKTNRAMTDAHLAEEIEKQYGQRIVETVCQSKGLSQGSCLLIALQVAREE